MIPCSLLSTFPLVFPIAVSGTTIYPVSQNCSWNLFLIPYIHPVHQQILQLLPWKSKICILLTTSISTAQVQATWIATIVSCSPLFVLSGLFSIQQPEPCFKVVFSCDTKNKTKVHTKTMHDQTRSCLSDFISSHPFPYSLHSSHSGLLDISPSCQNVLAEEMEFPLPCPLFPKCFFTSFGSLLEWYFLRKLFPGYLM